MASVKNKQVYIMKGKVNLYRSNLNSGSPMWELYRTYKIEDEIIKSKIIEALEDGPSYNSYKWECFDSNGDFQGNIFNMNYSTFKYVF